MSRIQFVGELLETLGKQKIVISIVIARTNATIRSGQY
jgi:hypothetical protein